MILLEPTVEYARQIKEFRRELLLCGDTMDGTGALKMYDDPERWIAFVTSCKDPDKVRPGLVPATQFICVREEDKKIVEDAVKVAKEEINCDDVDKIKAAIDKLSAAINPVFTKLYQQDQGGAPTGDAGGDGDITGDGSVE